MDFVDTPKVALHDHLDGGVRPSTLIELAREFGVVLPSYQEPVLQKLIADGASQGSLDQYLKMFGWTVPVMQTRGALTRIGREAVEDLAADGVVLAEVRFAPLLHTDGGLTAQEAIDAVLDGLRMGCARTGVPVGLILCGIRSRNEFDEVADLFEANCTGQAGAVVGVDLAGPEFGYPVSMHPGIRKLAERVPGASITIHAGEADGVRSIWEAIDAGAKRIGHGTRLIDDILGDRTLLRTLVDRRVLLEVCVSSNAQTGCISGPQAHPLRRFVEEGVVVNIDVDNRLMSNTSYSREYALVDKALGLGERDFKRIVADALSHSFLGEDSKNDVARRLRQAYKSSGEPV
jgi:adenosine deaminase